MSQEVETSYRVLPDAIQTDSNCNLCPLHQGDGHVCIGSKGSSSPTMLIVGEAPGKDEAYNSGKPFTGPAGQKQEELLRQAEVPLDEVSWTNSTKCFPSVNGRPRRPTEEEFRSCAGYLYREIAELDPGVIVTVGSASSRLVAGMEGKITQERGRPLELTIAGRSYTVVPTIHPSAVLRSGRRRAEKYEKYIVKDYREAYDRATGVYGQNMPEVNHVTDIFEVARLSKEMLKAYQDGEIAYIGYDLETNRLDPYWPEDQVQLDEDIDVEDVRCSRILGIALAFSGDVGYYIDLDGTPLDEERDRVWKYVGRVLDHVPVVAHNAKFDFVWTAYHQDIAFELYRDTMLMSYSRYGELRNHDLKGLLVDHLDYIEYGREVQRILSSFPKAERSMEKVPKELLVPYACYDAAGTYALVSELEEEASEWGLEVTNDLLTKASDTFSKIEVRGVSADLEFLSFLEEDYPPRLLEAYKNTFRYDIVKRFTWEKFGEELGFFQKHDDRTDPDTHRQRCLEFLNSVHEDLENDEKNLDEWKARYSWNPFSAQQATELVYSSEYMHQPCEVFTGTETDEGSWAAAQGYKNNPSLDEKAMIGLIKRAQSKINKYLPPEAILEDIDPRKVVSQEDLTESEWEEFSQACTYADLLRDIRKYRKLYKLVTSYVLTIRDFRRPNTEKITVQYKIHGTASGRFSTTNMSLQTIPWKSDIKRLIWSEWHDIGGVTVNADYAQAELRVLASLAGEEKMIEVFNQGEDIHRFGASQVYKKPMEEVTISERRFSKRISFGIIFERGEASIAEATGLTEQEAKDLLNRYFDRFPRIRDYIDDAHREVKETGMVRSPLGRIRHLPKALYGDYWEVARACRQANNLKIQSTASDATLISILVAQDRFIEEEMNSRIFGFIHDGVLTDVYPGEILPVLRIKKKAMEVDAPGQLPFLDVAMETEFDLGSRWGSGVEVLSELEQVGDTELSSSDLPEPGAGMVYDLGPHKLDVSMDLQRGILPLEGKLEFIEELVAYLRRGQPETRCTVFQLEKEEKGEELIIGQAYAGNAGGSIDCRGVLEVPATV